MGVKTIDSDGEGYAKFGKGENAYLKPAEIDTGWNDYQDEPQLEFVFQAISSEEGTTGRVPGYISSKITVQEDDDFSSTLAKLLQAAGKLEEVLADLDVSEEQIEKIVDPKGDMRYEADDEAENEALFAAVVDHLSDVDSLVMKGGTKLTKEEEYSKVTEIYERVDEDPFADDGSGDDTASESDGDAESGSEESAVIA